MEGSMARKNKRRHKLATGFGLLLVCAAAIHMYRQYAHGRNLSGGLVAGGEDDLRARVQSLEGKVQSLMHLSHPQPAGSVVVAPTSAATALSKVAVTTTTSTGLFSTPTGGSAANKKHGFDIEAAADFVIGRSKTKKWRKQNVPFGKNVDDNFERSKVVAMMHTLSEDKWTQPVNTRSLFNTGYTKQFGCFSAAAAGE